MWWGVKPWQNHNYDDANSPRFDGGLNTAAPFYSVVTGLGGLLQWLFRLWWCILYTAKWLQYYVYMPWWHMYLHIRTHVLWSNLRIIHVTYTENLQGSICQLFVRLRYKMMLLTVLQASWLNYSSNRSGGLPIISWLSNTLPDATKNTGRIHPLVKHDLGSVTMVVKKMIFTLAIYLYISVGRVSTQLSQRNIYSKSSQFYKLSRYKKLDSPMPQHLTPICCLKTFPTSDGFRFPLFFFGRQPRKPTSQTPWCSTLSDWFFSGLLTPPLADSRPMLANSSIEQWSKRASGCLVYFIFFGGMRYITSQLCGDSFINHLYIRIHVKQTGLHGK